MKLLRIMPILTIAILFCATQAFSEQKIKKLKASKTPPKQVIAEEKEAKIKHPKSGKPLLKKSKTPPQHVIAEEKDAKIKHPKSRGRNLSAQELKAKLRTLPGEREKLDKADKGFRPTSQIDKKRFLLASLNPFSVPEAHAQSPLSVTLSASNYFRSLGSYAYFHGLYMASGSWYWSHANLRKYGDFFPFADIVVNIPSTGWYIINCYAYGNNNAILQHSGIEVASWNFSARPSPYEWQDHPTIQYLEAGTHYFHFEPQFNKYYRTAVESISIDFYR